MSYLSFFKLYFNIGLQYRISAIAGLMTQFFWGLMNLFLYEAFYKNGIPTSLNWSELVTYIWLTQSFFAIVLFHSFDKDIASSIETGQVAYELTRPLSIYWMWFSKICAQKLSGVLLRFWPVLLIASLLPATYALSAPHSLWLFILFLIALVLGFFINVAFSMLICSLIFFTTSARGLITVLGTIGDFFSGLSLPLAFMPQIIQTISNILPFRYTVDFPFKTYMGNISMTEVYIGIIFQVVWISIIILIGNLLMKKTTKKLVVQGG